MTFKHYDKDKDQLLSYQEFVNMMAPKDERYKDVLIQRKSYNQGSTYARANCFLPSTQSDFKRLLLLLVDTEVRINEVKKSLVSRKNFKMDQAFTACGGSKEGLSKLGPDNFNRFFMSQGFFASDRQLSWLMSRLVRFGNADVDIQDFEFGLTPL